MTKANSARMIEAMRKFPMLKPILRESIPMGRGRRAGLSELQVVREFDACLGEIKRSGLDPYEIAAEIDLTTPEMVREKNKRKSFPQSFRNLLKDHVKRHGLQGKLEIKEYNHGERFFVVGAGE